MAIQIKKATKSQSRLRMAIDGPSGSGKTFSALSVGSQLLLPGQRLGYIDTERGSASKYADKFDFDVVELESFEPASYIEAMRAFAAEGYAVVVIDSLSHAWSGKGGALDMKDAVERKGKGNSYTAWREVTPHHNALIDAMLQSPYHLIVTMRTKTEYVLETNDKGRQVPKKVGMAPVQREGMEYEFDVVLDIDLEHVATISKTRCFELADKAFRKPGADIAGLLKTWLGTGTALPAAVPTTSTAIPSPAVSTSTAAFPAPVEMANGAMSGALAAIEACRTQDELFALVPKFEKLPEDQKTVLRDAFNAKNDTLT